MNLSQQQLLKKADDLEKIVDDIFSIVRATRSSTMKRLDDLCKPESSDDQRVRDSNQGCQLNLP
jgi:hypothetical protein